MSDDLFKDLLSLQEGLVASVQDYRVAAAEALRVQADRYAMEGLNSSDTQERAWLEGVSEGLRTAAAEIDPGFLRERRP